MVKPSCRKNRWESGGLFLGSWPKPPRGPVLEIMQSGLLRSWNIRQVWIAISGTDCIGFDRAVLNQLNDIGDRVAHVINLASDQCIYCGRAARERHLGRLHSKNGVEQQASDM